MQFVNNLDNSFFDRAYNPTFRISSSFKKPKTVEFFELLYNYPTTIKINWNTADEFSTDSFLRSNYGIIKHSFPFIDFVDHYTFRLFSKEQKGFIEDHSYAKDFINSYGAKSTTSKF